MSSGANKYRDLHAAEADLVNTLLNCKSRLQEAEGASGDDKKPAYTEALGLLDSVIGKLSNSHDLGLDSPQSKINAGLGNYSKAENVREDGISED